MGTVYPRPEPRSVSCEVGPLGPGPVPVRCWTSWGPADSHWELPHIMLVMGKFYPRPVSRSVSCEAGPHLVPGPRRSFGLAGPCGVPLGTAENCAGHGEGLPPTRAPQRELRGGTPWVPGPCLSDAGLAGAYGFPLGTAVHHVGHGEGLPPTSAPQRELRGGTPLGPGPAPVQCWTGLAPRIPTRNCRQSCLSWGSFSPDKRPAA